MERNSIFKILNSYILLNYKSRSELAKKIGIRKQELSRILKKLESNKNITLKSLERLCDGLGYEIIVRKKKTK